MKFEDLSAADQKLLNTDLGSFEKEASAHIATCHEMYSTGFNKLASETADYLDALYSAEAEEKVAEESMLDGESEKLAEELGSFIERGYFDGLRKLGSERYDDEMAYFFPFIEEKIAEAGSEYALSKLAERKNPDPEGHFVRRALLGNPISSAIEAEKGKKMKAFGKAWLHGAGEALKGVGVGGAGGAATGALASLASRGKIRPKAGALLGGALGANAGAAVGGIKGHFDEKASKIHGEYSKNKK